MKQTIPAGLIDNQVEIFSINSAPYTVYKMQVFSFDRTPKHIINKLIDNMKSNPTGESSMARLTGSDDDIVKVKQWMICRFGRLDETPDIDFKGEIQDNEYVPCPLRGECKEEGKGCCLLHVNAETVITKSEMNVLKEVLLPEKLIAEKLFKSPETIRRHMQTIRTKTRKANKAELVSWAKDHGVI